jgi:hypothetical protein
MAIRNWCLASIIVLFVVALSGCALAAREPALSPQEVVTQFYRWYIGYPGNPLVDKEYRASPHLASSFIQAVDQTLASQERGGGDPFLLAQDIPERFAVGEATVSGEQAGVALRFYWGGNPTPSHRLVYLERIEGEWKIAGVSIPEL